MTDLTEQWKKGKLKEGAYYVRNEQGVIFTAENYVNYDCFNDTKIYDFYNVETDIKEVLAPVPSYAEYMRLVDYKEELTKACKMRDEIIKKYEDIDSWWQAENQKLKKLLKECRDVAEFTKTIVNKHKWFDEVITKIDEVLNESTN